MPKLNSQSQETGDPMTEPGMAARTRSQIPEGNLKLNNIQSPQRKLKTKNYYKITCDPNATIKSYRPSLLTRVDLHGQENNSNVILSNKKLKKKESIQEDQLVTSRVSNTLWSHP